MSIEQFTVQPTFVILIALGLVVVGIIVLVTGLRGRMLEAEKPLSLGMVRRGNRWVYMIAGIMVIGIGVGLYVTGGMPSTITVGSGYVSIQSPPFFGTGNMKITSSEIASAYVGQIGSGNLSLSKQEGTSDNGNLNIGVFTLGNGHTAYVVSDNSADLIIQLKNGDYVVLGPSNTNALATSFSQSVYNLNLTN